MEFFSLPSNNSLDQIVVEGVVHDHVLPFAVAVAVPVVVAAAVAPEDCPNGCNQSDLSLQHVRP